MEWWNTELPDSLRLMKFPYRPHLLNLKLKEAARMPENSDAQVQEVSNRLHFQSSSHLCIIFKRMYGVTPL